jgi:hypothetical protein
MASPLRLVGKDPQGQDALMKRSRQANRPMKVFGSTLVALVSATLICMTGCSRQLAVPESSSTAVGRPLPFDRVSDGNGISPTDGLASAGIPAGTKVTIRLQAAVSSTGSRAGDPFHGVLDEPVVVGGKTLAPQGTLVTGSVLTAKPSGGPHDPGYLRVTLASIDMKGKSIPLETSSIFSKAGSYAAKSAMNSATGGKTLFNHGPGDVSFSTGQRLTFRLAQPLHLTD